MKYACMVAAAVFALFTYWQFNDLEQYGTRWWFAWVALYGVTGVLSIGAISRPLPRGTYLTLSVLAVVGALIRATSISWGDRILYNPTNPAGNETGGLIVVGLWLAALAYGRAREENLDA